MNRLLGALVGSALLAIPVAALSGDAPGTLDVELHGKKQPCQSMYEDAQIHVLRCTVPPGAVAVRESRPPSIVYALSGGPGKVVDPKGTLRDIFATDVYWMNHAISWREYTNTGKTTERFLIIEKKYEH